MGLIVHFGLGNFARAHLIDYTSDAGGWDVIGISLRSADVRDGLAAQGFTYDLCIQGMGVKRIEVLKNVLVAHENPKAVLDAMAQADVVSATVTEKGYHLDATGRLDLDDPAIAKDLQGTGPTTLIAFLARGLAGRIRPVTVLSCDNRVANGTTLQAAVMAFAQTANLRIDWTKVRFPNAMVDRITPATTDAVRKNSGDRMAVPTEAFREWVVEDDFAGLRPDWPGVQFVDDVAPHELRKLRMLNGAHSLMAYSGLAKGHEFVHEAIVDPQLRELVHQLMRQAGATLPSSVRDQATRYAQALILRFENPELAHRLDQIAMDGSQKLPHRFIGTLRDAPGATAVIAGVRAWIRFCVAETAQGRALIDPKADGIAQHAASNHPTAGLLELIGARDLTPLISA